MIKLLPPIPRLTIRILAPLGIILIIAAIVRAYADGAAQYIKPYMSTYFTKELAGIAELPWWSVFLPLKPFGGRWGTTGFLLVHWLENGLGEPNTYYLLTEIMVAVGYLVTYLTFRSLSLACLFGFALATSTFNYHVYTISGSVIILPLVSFLFLSSYCQVEWIRRPHPSWIWYIATTISCLLLALSYEGWLDVVPLIWIIYTVLVWHFWRCGDSDRSLRCIFVFILVTVVAIGYSAIKARWGLEELHPRGGEADLIFTYGRRHVLLMLEDVISSYFTFFFTTISTYFPPQLFSFSLSSLVYGPDEIVALQDGYHPQAAHLTHYNHLFLWRYYAGFFLAIFLMLYAKVIWRFYEFRDTHNLVLFLLMTSTLIGSPTHLIIKWRPMHAAPFLGYQCYLSIMGFTLLLCYIFDLMYKKWGGKWGLSVGLLLVFDFGYCAYARPALLSHMSQESFLGKYPDPRINLRPYNPVRRFFRHSEQLPASQAASAPSPQ